MRKHLVIRGFFFIFAADMLRLPKIIRQTLSVRLSLMVVSSMALLLLVSLLVMLVFSRRVVKEEALQNASQTLEGTMQCIDNILLSVEQSTGNFYFTMLSHLDNPEMMDVYCRKLVETNRYVNGCAIGFKPYHFNGHEQYFIYYQREESNPNHIVKKESFGTIPYTEQRWYTQPLEQKRPGWLNPLKDVQVDMKPIFTFSLPITNANGETVGVIGVDMSLSVLSKIVETVKPSPNSYCTLLDDEGDFMVHPDSKHQLDKSASKLSGTEGHSIREAVKAMVNGETGYRPIRMNGGDFYIFYKPFERSAVAGRTMEKLGWSVGVIYPEDDITGDYNVLFYYVLAIAVIGLLLLFLLSRTIIHRQLQPLQMLTEKAQRIAQGHYEEVIPDSRQEDEIGRLQNNFQQMQRSLAAHIGELEQITTTLRQHGEHLREAYNQVQKADRIKTAFLHNMTNQMADPAEAILQDVNSLSDSIQHTNQQDTGRLVDDIQKKGKTIAELLNNLLNLSDKEIRKEVDRD